MTNEPLHRLLLRAQSAMNRDVLARASKLGLSPGQPKILEFLLQTGESNQKSIADYCEIEPATAGTILGRMERDGLIARARHEGNRRSLYVTLTPTAGRWHRPWISLSARPIRPPPLSCPKSSAPICVPCWLTYVKH